MSVSWPTRSGLPSRPIVLSGVGIIVAFASCCWLTGLTPANIWSNLGKLPEVARLTLVVPDFVYFPTLLKGFAETAGMALLGSGFAILLTVPLAFLASSRTTPFMPLAYGIRWTMAVLRAVPDLVWAIAFVSATGLGPTAGVGALAVTTLAFLVKFHQESLDGAPKAPEDGVRAHGASWLAIRLYGVLPSAMPDWLSQWVYSLDSNIRAAAILGLVGAGGIGFEFTDAVRLSQYNRMGMMVIGIALMVGVLDLLGDRVRRHAL